MAFMYLLRIRNRQQSKYQYFSLKQLLRGMHYLRHSKSIKILLTVSRKLAWVAGLGTLGASFHSTLPARTSILFCFQTLDTGQHSNRPELFEVNSQRSIKTEHRSSRVCERLSHLLPPDCYHMNLSLFVLRQRIYRLP